MPVTRRKNQALISLISIIVILAIDQYAKYLTSLKLTVGQSIPIIKDILHITFVKNTGAAFGLFKDSALVFIVISIAAIILMSTLILRSVKREGGSFNPVFHSGLILIVSGALGNLIDRLRFSYVIDFIDVRIWPVFNIADTSITIGTILLILSFFPSKK